MSKYQVWIKGKEKMGLVKTYPYKIQAIIWCFLNKFVNSGRGYYFLDPKVEIKEVKDEKYSRKERNI